MGMAPRWEAHEAELQSMGMMVVIDGAQELVAIPGVASCRKMPGTAVRDRALQGVVDDHGQSPHLYKGPRRAREAGEMQSDRWEGRAARSFGGVGPGWGVSFLFA